MTPSSDRVRLSERLAARRRRYKQRGPLYRVGFTLAGVMVTLAGIALLALPGPAFVVIPIGLAMLAMEFAWAEAALEKALAQAEKAQAATRQASTGQKLATAGLIVLVVAAALVAIYGWDITVPVLNPSS